MATSYETKNLSQIFQLIKNKTWVLPNFQRDYVWDKEDQKQLIASLLLKYPVGSLLTLSNENEDSLVESREIGVRRKHFTPEHKFQFGSSEIFRLFFKI